MPHPIDVHVGTRLRTFRKRAQISQHTLGERLGITFQQVQKYERGNNRISASKLYDAANVLGVNIAAFFEGINSNDAEAMAPHIEQDLSLLRLIEVYRTISGDAERKRLIDLLAIMARP